MTRALTALTIVCAVAVNAGPVAAKHMHKRVASDADFLGFYQYLTDSAARDPRWQRIPIDTDAQSAAFTSELHDLYTGRQSEDAFFVYMDLNYEGHDYEKAMIINLMNIYRESH